MTYKTRRKVIGLYCHMHPFISDLLLICTFLSRPSTLFSGSSISRLCENIFSRERFNWKVFHIQPPIVCVPPDCIPPLFTTASKFTLQLLGQQRQYSRVCNSRCKTYEKCAPQIIAYRHIWIEVWNNVYIQNTRKFRAHTMNAWCFPLLSSILWHIRNSQSFFI